MLPETQEARQELGGFISEAIEIGVKRADLNATMREIKETVKDRWDISGPEFTTLVKAVIDSDKLKSQSDTMTNALRFVAELDQDEEG